MVRVFQAPVALEASEAVLEDLTSQLQSTGKDAASGVTLGKSGKSPVFRGGFHGKIMENHLQMRDFPAMFDEAKHAESHDQKLGIGTPESWGCQQPN